MRTKITGHRGYSKVAPENTLPAFVAAVQAGAERIELDVHESRDGQLVVHHDYYLGRTNDGVGPIHEQDWESLCRLDAGSWFSVEYASVRLCRLEDVFERFGPTVEYEIELKWPSATLLNAVLELTQSRGLLPFAEFTSPFVTALGALRERYPEARRGIFLSTYPEWMASNVGRKLSVGNAAMGKFAVAHCPHAILEPLLVEMLRYEGILVHAADCEDSQSLRLAFELGVDQISTSEVELAVQIGRSR